MNEKGDRSSRRGDQKHTDYWSTGSLEIEGPGGINYR